MLFSLLTVALCAVQTMAHVVLRVRRVRRRAAGRVHGARGRAVLRARLPAHVRRALRLLPAVHLRQSAAGTYCNYLLPLKWT